MGGRIDDLGIIRRRRAAFEAVADRYASFRQLPIGSLRWVAS
jgi:hypothetical protein